MGADPQPEPQLRGVDGCRAGWLCLSLPVGEGPQAQQDVIARLLPDAQALAEGAEAAITTIDIPIGLVDGRPRRCDQEARRRLGPRLRDANEQLCRRGAPGMSDIGRLTQLTRR